MRTLLIVLFCLLPIKAFAVIDYQLNVQLIPETQSLTAGAKLSLDESLGTEIQFYLADSCQIMSVKQSSQELEYRFAEGLLSVSLHDREPVSISYQGRFADQVSSVPAHNEDPGYGIAATIGAKGIFLSSSAGWYPQLNAGNINYRLQVKAPSGIEAISSGKLISRSQTPESTESNWLIDYPLSGLTLAAGSYQVVTDQSGSTPIYAYFYADSAEFAPIYLQAARSYLQLYEERFGPYPFHKFAIVENFFPTGYGFSSWTLLGSSVIRLPFIVKTSLGHEIAHSWWGTGVRVDYNEGNWAEGLTTYVADYLYKELESPEEALEYRLKILRDYAVLVDSSNSFPLSRFSSRNDRASQAIGYGKAAMLFHMLRAEVGDKIFWATLKQIATTQMFATIGWNRIAEYFSQAAERDLQPFFDQWLKLDGGPQISLHDIAVESVSDGYKISGTVRQTSPLYRLKIPLRIETVQGTIEKTLQLDATEQPFSLNTQMRPKTISLDPANDLFRILSTEEIPITINAIRSSRDLLGIYADSHPPSAEAVETLLAAFRQTGITIKPLSQLSQQDLAEHDLLVFGVAKTVLPTELRGNRLLFAERETDLEGNSVFLVRPSPYNNNRVIGWFFGEKNPQDVAVARKIPHYGKYSHVVFNTAENRLKGTFPPTQTPLTIKLEN